MPIGLPWQRAVNFAASAHRHHTRKDGTTPYAAHVFRVAMTIRHVFGCDDELALIAALLHDTIEDTTTDYDDIAESFGTEVADCVAALTKNMMLAEPMRESDYDNRLSSGPWQARLIKLADVYDNLTDAHNSEVVGPLSKLFARANRALTLAQQDLQHHPAVATASRIVEELVCEAGGSITPTR